MKVEERQWMRRRAVAARCNVHKEGQRVSRWWKRGHAPPGRSNHRRRCTRRRLPCTRGRGSCHQHVRAQGSWRVTAEVEREQWPVTNGGGPTTARHALIRWQLRILAWGRHRNSKTVRDGSKRIEQLPCRHSAHRCMIHAPSPVEVRAVGSGLVSAWNRVP